MCVCVVGGDEGGRGSDHRRRSPTHQNHKTREATNNTAKMQTKAQQTAKVDTKPKKNFKIKNQKQNQKMSKMFFFLSLSFLFSKPTNKCCCKKSHISNKSCRALEPLENKTASKSARPCFCFPLSLSETRHRTPCRHSLHQHQLHAKNLKPAS